MNNKEQKYCVYMHTNKINGKKYIGITCQQPPEKRWGRNGYNYKKSNPHFYNAINKYGWDSFKHEILFSNLTKEEACQKEIELIAYYNATNKEYGYNISNGGCGINMFTEETRMKMSEAHKKIDMPWTKIPVCQYDLNGNFIRQYESASQAARECGLSDGAQICYCCKNLYKTVAGYIWRYAGDILTKEHVEWCNSSDRYAPNKKSVCQYSMDGLLINVYDNILLAEKETGADHSVIIRCCNNQCKTAGGYIWRYYGDILTEEHLKWCNSQEPKLSLRKAVVQLTIEFEFIARYDSATEAERVTGIKIHNISSVCNHKRQKTAGGYIWIFESEIDKYNIIMNMDEGEINIA